VSPLLSIVGQPLRASDSQGLNLAAGLSLVALRLQLGNGRVIPEEVLEFQQRLLEPFPSQHLL
jgi:hypothetical protein